MKFRVFYMTSDSFRQFCGFGDNLPTLENLNKTHRELHTIEATDLEAVYHHQQAHVWAKDWEATNALLDSKGLAHTSMSVGDVVENVETGEFFAVGNIGFKSIGVNSWTSGLPPGKYYEGMTDDFEVYYSPVGIKWHRRRL